MGSFHPRQPISAKGMIKSVSFFLGRSDFPRQDLVMVNFKPLCPLACLIVFMVFSGSTLHAARAEDPVNPGRVAPTRTQQRPAVQRVMPRPIQDANTQGQVPSPPQAIAPGARTQAVSRPPAVRPVARPVARPSRGAEEAVDLGAMDNNPSPARTRSAAVGAAPAKSSMAGMNPHSAGGGTIPNFKFFYDFVLRNWKGGGPDKGSFSFDNYHQKMLVEFTPNQDFTFSASILGLDYYEVDYLVSPTFQVRWGKIWIPFDDMSPHNIFGGRINTSEFRQGNESAFLPDIWADLGVGLKWTLADSPAFSSVLHAYIVNGFGSGGSSPVNGDTVTSYPNFSASGTEDSNDNKAVGGRITFGLGQRFSIGASAYRGAYTPKSALKSQGITIMGGDMQIRPTNSTEIRFGTVAMEVGLNGGTTESFTRGGTYIEFGQKFGLENRWKFLVRAGKAQNDNRVVDISDKTLVGATLLRNFGHFEGQVTLYKDTKKVDGKVAADYAALRLVTAF